MNAGNIEKRLNELEDGQTGVIVSVLGGRMLAKGWLIGIDKQEPRYGL
jgi:hypothetical protein